MGGKAFSELGEDAFPRMPPEVYTRLKMQLSVQLKSLYKLVDVPVEAPEKEDHGDIDFIVCGPLLTPSNALERVQECLGACHIVLQAGNRTSNFAIPAGDELGPQWSDKFFQVDVHVCNDEAEWNRVLFFNSYGDLGMILGLLARANGFGLGSKGLKTHFAQADDRHISSFFLSDSLDKILPFFELSMEEWERGFPTLASIFAWVQSSRFFKPRRLVVADPTRAKKAAHNNRKMYSAFLEFSHALAIDNEEATEDVASSRHKELSEEAEADAEPGGSIPESLVSRSEKERSNRELIRHTNASPGRTEILEEALVYFGRKDEYDAQVLMNINRRALREKLNGTKVIAWTGLEGLAVKRVMDGVREKLSADEIVDMQEDEIRKIALAVRNKLNLGR